MRCGQGPIRPDPESTTSSSARTLRRTAPGTRRGAEDRGNEVAGASGVEGAPRHEPAVEDRTEESEAREFGINVDSELATGHSLGDHIDQALTAFGRVAMMEGADPRVALGAFDERRDAQRERRVDDYLGDVTHDAHDPLAR